MVASASSLLFLDDVVLLALSGGGGHQLALEWFTAEFEIAGIEISHSKSEAI